MRVVVQGPPPTQPTIQVMPVTGSGSELDVVLEAPSTGPAPPYLYRLERADDPSNPVNWTLVAEGENVFQGDPPSARVDGFSPGEAGRFRVTAIDSASPARSSEPVITPAVQTNLVGLAWPVQDAGGRITALPGVNVWGSDSYGGSGRHPDSTGVNTYIVRSLANGNTGTLRSDWGEDTYDCTFEFAWEHNAGGRSKQIIIAVSGVCITNHQLFGNVNRTSVWGQFAPGPGLFLRGAVLNAGGGSHIQMWHIGCYVSDDQEATTGINNRDAFKTGEVGTGGRASHHFHVNCEYGWTTDEAIEYFYPSEHIGIVYCAFLEGISDVEQPGPWSGQANNYGPLLGAQAGTAEPRFHSFERNLIAHFSDRQPYIGTRYSTVGNNLHYNCGRVFGGTGRLANYTNQHGHVGPCLHNNVRSFVIRGPNNTSSIPRNSSRAEDGDFPVGSGVYFSEWAQHGWGSTQVTFDPNAGNFSVLASPQTIALPPGRSTSLADMLQPFANPNAPTTQEKLDFAALMAGSVGMNPNSRSADAGRLALILQQIDNALNDIPQSPQMATGRTWGDFPLGDWFSPSPVIVDDPLDPGPAWHAPLPVGANVHTPLTSGTFSNGMSCVGYTPREVWAIEQHWYRGGK